MTTKATLKLRIVFCGILALVICLGLVPINGPLVWAAGDETTPPSVEELSQRLKEDDVEARREAVRQLAINAPERMNDATLIPVLKHALTDVDAQVRAVAAATAARVAWARATAKDSKDKTFDKNGLLEPLLISLVSDSSADVRDSAVMALSFGYKPSEKIQQTISEQFTEETNVKVRNSIVGLIELHGYTNERAENLLVQALSDCHGSVRQAAASYMKKWATQATFDALVTAFRQEGVASTRQAMLAAIMLHPDRATDYIKQLETTLTELSEARQSLQGSLTQLRRHD